MCAFAECVCSSWLATFTFSILPHLLTFCHRVQQICMIFAFMRLIYYLIMASKQMFKWRDWERKRKWMGKQEVRSTEDGWNG